MRIALTMLAPLVLACGGGPDAMPDCVDGVAPAATFLVADFAVEAGKDLVVRGEASGANVTAVYVLGTPATRLGIDFTAWEATIPAATLSTHAASGEVWLTAIAVDACNNRSAPVCPEAGSDTGDTGDDVEAGNSCARIVVPAGADDTGDTAAGP